VRRPGFLAETVRAGNRRSREVPLMKTLRRACPLLWIPLLAMTSPAAFASSSLLLEPPAATLNAASIFPPGTLFAVDTANTLRHYDPAAPGQPLGAVPISGLAPGENILAIDFRPSTGQLYGLGSTSRVYVIHPVTALAFPVGSGFTPLLTGTDFGFDFNPVTDRIRVASDAEQNLRLDPDTGAVANVDADLNPPGNVVGSAYSNNFAGASATVLYAIDSNSDQLLIQNPPNSGTLSPVGPLVFDTTGLVGFDIAPGSGIAYASLTAPAASTSTLFTVNLQTGAVSAVGTLGGGVPIRGIAVVTGPETVFGVTTGNVLVRFQSHTPGVLESSAPITGLQPGENVLGIDFRPATGELYAVGSTSRLYRIDTANGAAVAVGGPFSTPLNGTDFGVDFNPQADRLRVVSDAEQNLRIDPNTGAVAGVDTPLNPPGNVVAAAYTNDFAGAPGTTLYDLDSGSDLLLIQNPPNLGTLSAVGPLQVDFTGLAGLDVAPSGVAYASLTAPAGASSQLYTVSLATGAATLVGTIGGGATLRDIAVRLSAEVIYGVTQTAGGAFNLVTFNGAVPGVLLSTVGITGLQSGEILVGIDFRPATGQLFAIGSTNRVYVVDRPTGVATAVDGPFTPALTGTSFGMDFNPTVDRIRLVSDAEQNMRLNPNTGLVVNVDTNLNPAGNVVAAAYTNNFAGATTTTLYDIDSASDMLLVQNPPNNGTLIPVGSLGVDLGPVVGFDIGSGNGRAYVSGYLPAAVNATLFQANLQTGALTSVGTVNTTDTLVGISVLPTSLVAGLDTPGVYVPGSGAWFLRNSNSPGAADVVFTFGPGGGGFVPLRGDWDGDGDDTAGLYSPTTAAFFLKNTNAGGAADVVFTFGPAGAGFVPIVGDWDGDGTDTVGLYNPATSAFFLKNTNSGGAADLVFTFGAGGAVPLVGDWNNDGADTVGLYQPSTAVFFLRNSNSNGPADIPPFTFGPPDQTPLAGDWNGDGTDSIGIYTPATGVWFLSNGFTGGAADLAFTYGPPGAVPITGDWDGK
jgi:hypothetical protein